MRLTWDKCMHGGALDRVCNQCNVTPVTGAPRDSRVLALPDGRTLIVPGDTPGDVERDVAELGLTLGDDNAEELRPDGTMPRAFRTKSGRILTDEDIERLSDEAERGYDPSQFRARGLFDPPPRPHVEWHDASEEEPETSLTEAIVVLARLSSACMQQAQWFRSQAQVQSQGNLIELSWKWAHRAEELLEWVFSEYKPKALAWELLGIVDEPQEEA